MKPHRKCSLIVATALLLLVQGSIGLVSNAGAGDLKPLITLECVQNQGTYRPGDPVRLSVRIGNQENRTFDAELFVILYMDGNFRFWPSWTQCPDCLDILIQPGQFMEYVILDFISPEGAGSYSIWFWVVLWVENTWLYWCDFNVVGIP